MEKKRLLVARLRSGLGFTIRVSLGLRSGLGLWLQSGLGLRSGLWLGLVRV